MWFDTCSCTLIMPDATSAASEFRITLHVTLVSQKLPQQYRPTKSQAILESYARVVVLYLHSQSLPDFD